VSHEVWMNFEPAMRASLRHSGFYPTGAPLSTSSRSGRGAASTRSQAGAQASSSSSSGLVRSRQSGAVQNAVSNSRAQGAGSAKVSLLYTRFWEV
jgi:hypothetical protein